MLVQSSVPLLGPLAGRAPGRRLRLEADRRLTPLAVLVAGGVVAMLRFKRPAADQAALSGAEEERLDLRASSGSKSRRAFSLVMWQIARLH